MKFLRLLAGATAGVILVPLVQGTGLFFVFQFYPLYSSPFFSLLTGRYKTSWITHEIYINALMGLVAGWWLYGARTAVLRTTSIIGGMLLSLFYGWKLWRSYSILSFYYNSKSPFWSFLTVGFPPLRLALSLFFFALVARTQRTPRLTS